MFGNLPKIKDELTTNKRLKTEAINDNKYLTIKNNIMNNNKINFKNNKNKNNSGNSLDMKLAHKKEKSSLKFNTFMRNITFDTLKNKEIKLIKKPRKNKSNNAFANQSNTINLNKSGETIKYLNTNPNININIKNNINIFFDLKDKEKNKKKINFKKSNNNLQINIFKNNNYILNNNNNNTPNYLEKKNNMKELKYFLK